MKPYIKSIISLDKTPNQVLKFLLYEQAKEIQQLKNKLEKATLFLENQNCGTCDGCQKWIRGDCVTVFSVCRCGYCDDCYKTIIIYCHDCCGYYCNGCAMRDTLISCVKCGTVFCCEHWNENNGCKFCNS